MKENNNYVSFCPGRNTREVTGRTVVIRLDPLHTLDVTFAASCYSSDVSLESHWPQQWMLKLDWTGMFTSNSSLAYEINIGMYC